MLRLALTAILVTTPAGALAAGPWLPPTAVSPPVRGGGPPAVAGNDAGRAVAAWATRDGVRATLRTPAGPWFSPARVPGSGRSATDVTAAMTRDGRAVVAWVQGGRVRASVRPERRRFLPAATVSPRGEVASAPRVAFGLGCQPLVAWSADDRRGTSVIRAACGRGDGRFGAVAAVSPAGERASTPAVAGGPTGVIVLWRGDQGGAYRVRAATRGPVGGFSPAVTVSPASTAVVVDPSVALAPDGTAVAAWTLTRGDSVTAQAATRAVTGAWTAPADLSRPSTQVRGARAGVDAAGGAVVAWSRSGVVQAATRPPAGAWSNPTDLSDPSSTAGSPALAVSASGAAVVAWPAQLGGIPVAMAALRPAAGLFGAPAVISDPGRPATSPQAAIGDDGVAPVAWQWTDPAAEPSIAPSGVMAATGLTGAPATAPALVVDLRARPSRVRPGQPIRITFGMSSASRVRITARRAGSSVDTGSISLTAPQGPNAVVLRGGLGGASLGRGRWVITATPRNGQPRSLTLVVV